MSNVECQSGTNVEYQKLFDDECQNDQNVKLVDIGYLNIKRQTV